MALATAAAIAGIVGTGVGVAKSLSGGGGADRTQYDLLLRQLQDSQANSTNARIAAAGVNQMARSGFDDGQGGGLRYDPATGTWHSTLGPEALAAQRASDAATTTRNTTDMYRAGGANDQAAMNAARSQAFIDAARRRYEDFRPQTADELTALLTSQVADANNQTYEPMRGMVAGQALRSGNSAGSAVLDRLAMQQGNDLRRGMIDARVAALQNVGNINNTQRQGLAMDLGAANAAGTPNFQYPGIAPSTYNKDMLAALTSRANNAGYTSAYGLQAANQAQSIANTAGKDAAGAVPDPFAGLNRAELGLRNLSQTLGSNNSRALYDKIGGWFGPGQQDPTNTWTYLQDNPVGDDSF